MPSTLSAVSTGESTLKSILARQATMNTMHLANPAKTGYGAATKRKNTFIDAEVNPKRLPTFPSIDYMPTEATAQNDAAMTQRSFEINSNTDSSTTHAALDFQTHTGALSGYRTQRSTMNVMPSISPMTDEVSYSLDPQAYYMTMSSAEHGFRQLDTDVLSRVITGGRGPQGDSTFSRNTGTERFANNSINNRNALGLPYSSAVATPMYATVAPNHVPTKPILAAARNF